MNGSKETMPKPTAVSDHLLPPMGLRKNTFFMSSEVALPSFPDGAQFAQKCHCESLQTESGLCEWVVSHS